RHDVASNRLTELARENRAREDRLRSVESGTCRDARREGDVAGRRDEADVIELGSERRERVGVALVLEDAREHVAWRSGVEHARGRGEGLAHRINGATLGLEQEMSDGEKPDPTGATDYS